MRINNLLKVYKRKSIHVLPLILSLILVLFVGSRTMAVPTKSTEISWDTYGVPHIYGKDNLMTWEFFGY